MFTRSYYIKSLYRIAASTLIFNKFSLKIIYIQILEPILTISI